MERMDTDQNRQASAQGAPGFMPPQQPQPVRPDAPAAQTAPGFMPAVPKQAVKPDAPAAQAAPGFMPAAPKQAVKAPGAPGAAQVRATPDQATETRSLITVNAVVISHRGCARENNEDNFFFDGDVLTDSEVNDGAVICEQLTRPFHLFAICDGMGGLQGGERASAICVESMGALNMSLPAASIQRAIDAYADDACRRVYQDSLEIGEDGREGSTLAMIYMAGGKGYVGNVGDSRVYLLRMGKLFQLSTDHSPVFRMMQKGQITREQMRKHPQGNVIGAFIGMSEDRKPKPYAAHYAVGLCAGDRFMLCSDGLSDLISHDELQRRMAETKDPKAAASQLVWRALEMGGKDNTTCMILDVSGQGLPAPTAASLMRLPQER